MTRVCATSPLPSYLSLKEAFAEVFKFPGVKFPDLLTFGDLSLGSIDDLEQKISNWIHAFQQSSFLSVVKLIMDPIVSILGGAIDDLLPKLPVLELTFTNFISLNVNDLYEQIKIAFRTKYDELAALFEFPIFDGFDELDLTIPAIATNLFTKFFELTIGKLVKLIKQVTDILEIAGMPKLPEIPTKPEIKSMMLEQMQQYNLSLADAIKKLFPILPSPIIPVPLFDTKDIPTIELEHVVSIIATEFQFLPMKIITDFIQDILGVDLPVLCIEIDTPVFTNPIDNIA